MDYKNLEVGDIVEFKKSHPSKTVEWKLIKIGANFKFKSTIKFDLFIELNRESLAKNIKKIKKGEE